MAATDAVTSTAIARKEARASLDRMQYHLGRGLRGRRGVDREIAYLDNLHQVSITQAGAAVGVPYSGAAINPLGQKAVEALSTGNAATVGRMKSSILADFSADSLQPVRDEAPRLKRWKWTANASACPSCLDRHGRIYEGDMYPLHPSCLCVPQPIDTAGLRPLTDNELVSMSEQYGDPRYTAKLQRFKNGEISRSELSGVEAVNAPGTAGEQAVAEHLAKGEVQQVGANTAGIADDTGALPPADPDVYEKTADYYRNADGTWNAERNKLHDDIVDKFLKAADTTDEPEFYLMGGGPASGKSTMLEGGGIDVPAGRKAIQIDPDEIKKLLPEYQTLTEAGDIRAAMFTHEESSYISKRILKAAGDDPSLKSIVLDGTGDKGVDDLGKKLEAARAKGLKVKANYATNDTDFAWELAQKRARETGRDVPEEVLRRTHADVSSTFWDAMERGLLDEADLWDTNIYKDPRHVVSWREGKLVIHDEALLEDFLSKAKPELRQTVEELKGRFGLLTTERAPIPLDAPIEQVAKQVENVLRDLTPDTYFEASDGNADGLLEYIYKQQGFSEKPILLDADVFDAVDSEVLWRGVPLQEYRDNFIEAPIHRGGGGIYGNGTYAANDSGYQYGNRFWTGEDVAKSYRGEYNADDVELLQLKLPKDAKLADSAKLSDLKYRVWDALDDSTVDYAHWVDEGQLAAALGYDGINVAEANANYTVIFNRSITMVRKLP